MCTCLKLLLILQITTSINMQWGSAQNASPMVLPEAKKPQNETQGVIAKNNHRGEEQHRRQINLEEFQDKNNENRRHQSFSELVESLVRGKNTSKEQGNQDFLATSQEKNRGDDRDWGLARKKHTDKGQEEQENQSFLERITPIAFVPFVLSSSILPVALLTLKALIIKGAFIAKIAVLFVVLNMLRPRPNTGGVIHHNSMDKMSMMHYGYSGGEEYGAYVNW